VGERSAHGLPFRTESRGRFFEATGAPNEDTGASVEHHVRDRGCLEEELEPFAAGLDRLAVGPYQELVAEVRADVVEFESRRHVAIARSKIGPDAEVHLDEIGSRIVQIEARCGARVDGAGEFKIAGGVVTDPESEPVAELGQHHDSIAIAPRYVHRCELNQRFVGRDRRGSEWVSVPIEDRGRRLGRGWEHRGHGGGGGEKDSSSERADPWSHGRQRTGAGVGAPGYLGT